MREEAHSPLHHDFNYPISDIPKDETLRDDLIFPDDFTDTK
jgi:hypothetical protein